MMAVASLNRHHRRAGANAAAQVLQDTPELSSVPDSVARSFDAVAVDPVREHDWLDVRAELDRGDRVEFKSAIVRLSSGQRGRLNFRQKQHERLEELGGKYCVLVCEPKPDRRVLAGAIIEPSELERSTASWVTLDVPDRSERAFKQIGWGVLVDAATVAREGQEDQP